MASELRRGIVRMSANYGRQFFSLALNVLLIAMLFAWLGEEGFGLIVLVAATVGVAGLLDDLIRGSLIRELAHAHHSGDEQHFRDVYNSAWAIAAAGSVLCALAFAAAWALLPLLNIPAHLLGAARWMVIADGVTFCAWLLFSPALNMYIVQERFIADNIWTLSRKVIQPLAVLLAWKALGVSGVGAGVTAYVVLYNAGNVAILLLAAALIIASAARFRPAPLRATRAALREIIGTIGWNSLVNVIMNVHERIPAFVMYAFFGLSGSAVYGLAVQLASYVRMLTVGVNFGLEAVSARVNHQSGAGLGVGLLPLTRMYTLLHALMAAPGAAFLAFMAEPLVRLWVGRHLNDPALLPQIVLMSPILIVPVFARSMSECWIRIAYGAGFIRKISLLVLGGGIAHPVVSVILVYVLTGPIWRFNAPAIAFLAVFTFAHLVLLPRRVASILGGTPRDTVLPMLRPALAVLACSPILVVGRLALHPMNIAEVAVVGTLFGAAYLTLSWSFVLPPTHRDRLLRGLRTRLGLAGVAGIDAQDGRESLVTDAAAPAPDRLSGASR